MRTSEDKKKGKMLSKKGSKNFWKYLFNLLKERDEIVPLDKVHDPYTGKPEKRDQTK